MKRTVVTIILACLFLLCTGFYWGFFAHERINRLAVFTLPPEMIGFYKANIDYITEASVNPDKRRFSVVEEAPRHYLDADHYGDSAVYTMPRYWNAAVEKYSADTLKAYGILPWHIYAEYYQLKNAFLLRDPEKIRRLSAELGHYIADAHVPLHTTENYNGQLTGQEGIHAFWESRLPELFSDDYEFFVGQAEHLSNVQGAAWKAIETSHQAVKAVLNKEKELSSRLGDRKYSFETKGKQIVKVYSQEYASSYHLVLEGMVEKQMRLSVKMIGDIWFTAWVDAGQPDLRSLINHKPSEAELMKRKAELEQFKQQTIKVNDREGSAN